LLSAQTASFHSGEWIDDACRLAIMANMKALFLLVLCLAADSVTDQAQADMAFDNRNIPVGLDAPITIRETGEGPGAGYSAALYFNGSLMPESLTTFRTGSHPHLSRYLQARTVDFRPYGVEIGASGVIVEMRVWPTSAGSYEATPADQRGTSGLLELTRFPAANVEPYAMFPPSFTGFQIQSIPEPSTWAIALLGTFALAARFKRK
jgi:hypothetical protein